MKPEECKCKDCGSVQPKTNGYCHYCFSILPVSRYYRDRLKPDNTPYCALGVIGIIGVCVLAFIVFNVVLAMFS